MLPTETGFNYNKINRLKVNNRLWYVNTDQKKGGGYMNIRVYLEQGILKDEIK